MKKLLQLTILFITILYMISCGSDSGGPNPEITGLQPESGPPGTSVTISGKGFQPHGNMSVALDGTSAAIVSATEDQIQTAVPKGLSEGSAPVEVSVGGSTVSGPSFMVKAKAPGISSVEPDSGTVGTEVMIKGMNFSSSTSEVSISFAGTSAQVKNATEDQLITEVPQGASDGPIEVTIKQKSTTGPDFDVITEGVLEVHTNTTGDDKDSDRYDMFIDGADVASIANSGIATFPDIESGSHDLELSDIKSNCSVQGQNPRTVNITAGDTTSTTFEVECSVSTKDKIAFHSARDSDREIYLMENDGSNVQKLTDNGSFDGRPVISNDGKKIAFQSSRDGNNNLYVLKISDGQVKQVTNSSSFTLYFAWAPDDSKLAMTDSRSGNNEIYTINTDGSALARLTNNSANDKHPSWSPDGSKIAFASDRDGDFEIYTIDNNGVIEKITDNNARDYQPRWSPDGSKIVFSSSRGASFDIYSMDADGSNVKRITTNSSYEYWPSWSPDGSEVVFESGRDGNSQIYKISTDGSGSAVNLSNNIAADFYPSWSPIK